MSSSRTLPASPRGTSASGADGGDPRGDLGVGRRHDLAAVAEVDLVAVVLRRVVARGHHHAGHAAELADREGQQRRRQRPRHHQRPEPGAGHHLGGVAGEDVGVVAGVVPDHDGRAGRGAVVLEVRRQAGGRAGHDDAVHPVGAGAERAAQAGGAELQRPGEPVGELVARRPAAMSASSSARVTGSGSSAAQARARDQSPAGRSWTEASGARPPTPRRTPRTPAPRRALPGRGGRSGSQPRVAVVADLGQQRPPARVECALRPLQGAGLAGDLGGRERVEDPARR